MAISLGYLGPVGSFSNILTHKYFQSSTYQLHPFSRIQELFEKLDNRDIDMAIIPIRNSTFGEVRESAAERSKRPTLLTLNEYALRVEHCLVAREDTRVEDIELVCSHEQALGQCQRYLDDRSIHKRLKCSSTANATQSLSKQSQIDGVDVRKCAAICSESCAGLFENVRVLERGIQDNKAIDNTTTFYLMAYSDVQLPSNQPIESSQNDLFGL